MSLSNTLLGIALNSDKTGFLIGSFEVRFYGIIIAFGILVAFCVALWLFNKANYKEELAYLILVIVVPLGIIFARAYYVIFDPDKSNYQSFWDVINIRGGGIAIYGAVIGGALGLLIVARIKKCGWFTLADICAICLIIAQSIGRWGNYANREAHGIKVAHNMFPFTIPYDNLGATGPFLATFFIESMLNLIGFGVLLFIFFKNPKIEKSKKNKGFVIALKGRNEYKWGTVTAWYLIWYGIVRMIIEPFRTDSLLMPWSHSESMFNRVSFLLSIALIAVGVLVLVAVKKGWISQENQSCLRTNPTVTKKPKSTTT